MEKQIEFIDGSTSTVETAVSGLTLLTLQNDGVIDGAFFKGFMKEEVDMSPLPLLQAVYAAYIQHNGKQDSKSYNEFLESYVLDMEVDMIVYFAVITKQGRNKLAEKFEKKTGKAGAKK
ncbi:hypothetical protein [Paenilisteria rocourtiae]|uniref:Uncharacterized protein n=2 Tax=Listeria rocourtiae TaxID=647910 RepID=A0A4R6ZIA8_9LIST|nr:hypothetical protein [Listeria rocourtiae]TDR51734.1 hypothetical protein DFP96_11140 [Listeria rocourtiae]